MIPIHKLMSTLSAVLLKYGLRLKSIEVLLPDQGIPGELRYGTELMPEGRVYYAT